MKNKGFTLIELLAVIVILATIALIATPIIINIINDARNNSELRSVENVVKYASTFYADAELKSQNLVNKNIFNIVFKNFNGNKPDSGVIYINSKGEVAAALKYGDNCYMKNYSDGNISKSDKETCALDFDYIMEAASGQTEENEFFNTGLKRKEIEKIVMLDSNAVPNDVLGSSDLSEKENGSIMSYWYDEDENGLYELYIGQNGGVKANSESHHLFTLLINLKEIDLSNLDTSNVTNMAAMFQRCANLTSLDLNKWDTSNLKNISYMFNSCSGLTTLNISNWDTSKVNTMYAMFYDCNKLTTIYTGNWNTNNILTDYMFYNCTNLRGGAGTTYVAEKNNGEYAHIDGGESNPGYFSVYSE